MRISISFFVAFLLLASATFSQSKQAEFYHMLTDMYEQSVPLIMADELEKKGLDSYVILDTREPEEYQISHLETARLVGYDEFQADQLQDLPKDQPIVVYCSVGYRSERIGEKLKEMGFTQVYNLYGGIFDWKNRGNEVENMEGKPTDQVHTYNKTWGQWLLRGEKVY